MFAITWRFVAGMAVGGAAALLLASRQRQVECDNPAPRFDGCQELDGRIDEVDLVDEAVEETFPASDPPSFTQALIIGPPPHEEAAAVERRQQGKRADEDVFAE